MKEYFKNLLLFLLVFFFTTSIFEGIKMPENILYFFATIFILSTTVMIAKPLLNFLTININFLTYFLLTTLLLGGALFLLKIFMTGFYIETAMFEGINFDFVEINGFEMVPVVIITLFSILSSFICTIFNTLEKRS